MLECKYVVNELGPTAKDLSSELKKIKNSKQRHGNTANSPKAAQKSCEIPQLGSEMFGSQADPSAFITAHYTVDHSQIVQW